MKYFITVLLMVLTASVAQAASINLNFSWNANDPTEQITGYKLYMDQSTTENQVIADPLATATSFTFEDNGTPHSFTLVAYRDSDGIEPYIQSEHTATVIYVPPPIVARPIKAVGTFTIEILQ